MYPGTNPSEAGEKKKRKGKTKGWYLLFLFAFGEVVEKGGEILNAVTLEHRLGVEERLKKDNNQTQCKILKMQESSNKVTC